jgi:acyl-homoserine-lactone acylase
MVSRLSLLLPLSTFLGLAASCATAPAGLPQVTSGTQGYEVEILWDAWGVPHVYASDDEGIAYGYGWAQMHSHGDAILHLYGLARGRAAEYWGEEYLESDRVMHSLGVPASGSIGYAAQSASFQQYLDAFAAGVNEYARQNPQALSPHLRSVLPVEASDLISHAQRLGLTFASLTGDRLPLLGMDGMPSAASAGSNTWAIGPSRTASGNAMLLQNPHLMWDEPLMRFYEAHLVAPGVNIYGATLLGVPVPAIAFNERLGWSHTVNTVDVLDSYRLVLEEAGYRLDGAVLPFETSRQVILVRSEDGTMRPDTLIVRRSVHGPVLMGKGDTTAIAVRSSLLERYGALEQWWDMGRAGDLDEFEAALSRLQLPIFTVSYADRAGRIFYLFNGQIPRRPGGDFNHWQRPVRGDTSATIWMGIHDYEELPRLVDPASGFLQNANSPPWFATMPGGLDPASFPRYFAPDGLNLREMQSLGLLLGTENITLEQMIELRHSSGSLLADRILDELILAARSSGGRDAMEAAEVLAAWDRNTEPHSRGAVLFLLWAEEQCRGPMANRCGFDRDWSRSDPLYREIGLADPARAATALGVVAARVRERIGSLDVPWGEVMRIGGRLPGRGAPGDPLGVFQVVAYAPTPAGFRPVFGDGWVAALEFTATGPRGQVLLTYGNSSQPGSPHDGDQLPLLSRGEMRPLWFSRTDVEANLATRVLLSR